MLKQPLAGIHCFHTLARPDISYLQTLGPLALEHDASLPCTDSWPVWWCRAGGSTRYPRNEQGCFFVIYQPNKWKLKHAKLLAEREAAAAAATDHSGTAGKASGNGTGGRSDTPQTAVSAQVVGTKVAAQ